MFLAYQSVRLANMIISFSHALFMILDSDIMFSHTTSNVAIALVTWRQSY